MEDLTHVSSKDFEEGTDFDTINEIEICQKYIPRGNGPREKSLNPKKKKEPRTKTAIVKGQFAHHYDTAQLVRNMHHVSPETMIAVTDKWHGTSAVFANVMIQEALPYWKYLLYKAVATLFRWLGININRNGYGLVCSSRKVVKDIFPEGAEKSAHKATQGYYAETFGRPNVWRKTGLEIRDRIPQGFTVYGEIVGYTPSGMQIQKGYHYGCQPEKSQFLVYRVTMTNANGQVLELSWPQVKEFCAKYGFETVKELFYGGAYDLLCNCTPSAEYKKLSKEAFQEELLIALQKRFLEKPCPYNKNEVPAEGIVLRIDGLEQSHAFKLKSFLFKKRESDLLDQGQLDIETEESEQAQPEAT